MSRVYNTPQKWLLSLPTRTLITLAKLSPKLRIDISTVWIELLERVLDPHDKLDMYIFHHRHLPLQQSQQWLDEREFIIGGSEIAAIMGNSAYGTLKSVALSKLGLRKFNGNVCTRWGVAFEHVVAAIIEHEFNTSIYSTGSISGIHQDGVYIQTYSPDGLCVIEDKIVLLEIKSPYGRIPNNKVPKEYMDQVLLGLGTIPIAEYALFVDACFRSCSYTDWDFDARCNMRKKDEGFPTPNYLGFTITAEPGNVEDVRVSIRNLMKVPQNQIIEEAMSLEVYKHFAVHIASQKYGEPIICDTHSLDAPPTCSADIYFTTENNHRTLHIDTIKEYFKKGMIIKSITFWKLFYFNKVRVEREEGYMDKVRPVISNAIEYISNMRESQKIIESALIDE